jgi:thiol-disulfide isomerase/thioredoxin
MKTNLIILAIILAATVGWTLFADKMSPKIRALDAAPDFAFVTLEGDKGKLSQYAGKVVFVHFWATWCAPCLVEFPTLMDLARDAGKDIVILAIAVQDEEKNIIKFLKKIKQDIPENVHIIADPDKAISEALYQTIKLPETYVISGDQKIFERVAGAEKNWNSEDWKDKISRLSGE